MKDTNTSAYQENSEIGAWNVEGAEESNASAQTQIKENFARTQKFAMIKADGDTVVVPREGEWFGAYDSNYELLDMKDTRWYIKDTFGLRTADEAGKITFNSTVGNHLDFSTDELFGWLDLYLL